jgi:hypothetical protein
MYSTKLKIFRIEMHLEGVKNTTYLTTAVKVGENLLRLE